MASYPSLHMAASTPIESQIELTLEFHDEGGAINISAVADALASVILNAYPGATVNSRQYSTLSTSNV